MKTLTSLISRAQQKSQKAWRNR